MFTKDFLEANLILAKLEKLIFNVLHSQNVKVSTQIHSELSTYPFCFSCAFIKSVTTGYHELSYVLPYLSYVLSYMLPYLWNFCITSISYFFCHISRTVAESCPIHFQSNQQVIFQRLTTRYYQKTFKDSQKLQ